MADIDHSEVNRALAKAIAYKQCGKDAEACLWAYELVRLLECHSILRSEDDIDHIRGWVKPASVLPVGF